MTQQTEIERKWALLNPPSFKDLDSHSQRTLSISQTYLESKDSPAGTTRVRKTQEEGRPTIWEFFTKIPLSIGVNQETYYSITKNEYFAFLERADPLRKTIRKTRYVCPVDLNGDASLVMEIDSFKDFKLTLLEIELPATDLLNAAYELPSWTGPAQEVTGDKAYSNSNLALLTNALK